MNRSILFIFSFLLLSSLILFGCSSSEETQSEKEATEQQVTKDQTQDLPPPPPGESDTIDVVSKDNKEETSIQQPTTENLPISTGMYAVQVGAFKVTETADQIASLAKTRFSIQVLTLLDKETGLTKVLVGSFTTKAEARTFRDKLLQQYPDDYKDAWTTELPRE
ncbi:MAG: SPOR domain-containing protein [Ignavibacteriae bacterium]|nr:SPOR domain-containing protein [Ignavibacteriota bacterium]